MNESEKHGYIVVAPDWTGQTLTFLLEYELRGAIAPAWDIPAGPGNFRSREDFPKRDDVKWMKHTLAWADDATRAVKLDDRPVHTKTLTNEVKYIEPKARVY